MLFFSLIVLEMERRECMLKVNIRSAGYEIGEKIIHDIAFLSKKVN